jgi:two-component system chemotaxis sensor kinase CheA
MGGKIQVTSEAGKGSTFTLYLPCILTMFPSFGPDDSQPPQPLPGTEQPLTEQKNVSSEQKNKITKGQQHQKPPEPAVDEHDDILQGKKILLVDDDIENIKTFKRLLVKEGLEVITGMNGQEGLNALNENPDVNLVLMDIMTPVMDGYTAIREIRKLELSIRDVPIITVTGKAREVAKQNCIEAGASGYLTKPVDLDELLSMMEELISS